MTPQLPSTRLHSRFARGAGLIKLVVGSAAALLVVAGGVWALTRDGAGSAEVRAVADLDLAKVQLGTFEITTTAMGELEARKQVELRSELDTRAGIVEIVREGSVVKKGDLLVQLNAEELQDQIDQQMLEVERAQADVIAAENSLKIQLSENESRERAGQLKVELAELALAQWREGEVVKTREKQKLEIEQAERDLKRLKERFDRSESLLAEGFLSQEDRDLDAIRYVDGEARLQTALLDSQVYLEYQYPRDEKTKLSDLEEAKADLDRVISQNEINASAKQASLATTRRQFELKVERLEKLKQQFELATILAPTDGLVVYATSIGRGRDMNMMGGDGPLQIGREVRPNEELIILPDTTSMVASVRVHESLAGRIRPGQRVTIKIDALTNQAFFGTVESIGVLAESGGWRDPNRREYTVRIAIDHDNSDGMLKPSMRAEAEITLGLVEDSLMVPVQAVFAEGPIRYVLIPKGSRYERVPVKVGRMSDTFAEVSGGLTENQRVLLREPSSGEVINTTWAPEALAAVGIALDEEGKPISNRPSFPPGMMQTTQTMDGAGGSTTQFGAGAAGGGERPQRPAGAQGEGQRPEGQGRGRGRPGANTPQGAPAGTAAREGEKTETPAAAPTSTEQSAPPATKE